MRDWDRLRRPVDSLLDTIGATPLVRLAAVAPMVELFAKEHQYAFARTSRSDFAIVAFNNDQKPARFSFDITSLPRSSAFSLVDRLGNAKDIRVTRNVIEFELPPQSSSIIVRR